MMWELGIMVAMSNPLPRNPNVLQRGPGHPSYKGQWVTVQGGRPRVYMWIDEAMSSRLSRSEWLPGRSYAPRSRVAWLEAHPGERLTAADVIHHIDGNTLNDDPSNLEKHTYRSHRLQHAAELAVLPRVTAPFPPCEVCGAPVKARKDRVVRFCSRACSGKAHTKTVDPSAPKPARTRAYPIGGACEVCGKPVRQRTDRVVRFCSRTCFGAGTAGAKNINFGKSFSEERKQAISEGKRGYRFSQEAREKMRQSALARWRRERGY